MKRDLEQYLGNTTLAAYRQFVSSMKYIGYENGLCRVFDNLIAAGAYTVADIKAKVHDIEWMVKCWNDYNEDNYKLCSNDTKDKAGPVGIKDWLSYLCYNSPMGKIPQCCREANSKKKIYIVEKDENNKIKDIKKEDRAANPSVIKSNGASNDESNDDLSLSDAKEASKPHNRIIFGAPGTSKSHTIEEERRAFGDNYERVTFHPDYMYANFVGSYKPIMAGKDIRYQFQPGPFMRIYTKARQNLDTPYLLIIEEINRANVAAVFGDVFQLLDRTEDGLSEYPIATSEDIQGYFKLLQEKGEYPTETLVEETVNGEARELDIMKNISLPSNMYIWATMNSADQGVFPMDTAFKRRWDFEYADLNPDLSGWRSKPTYWDKWQEFRTKVNNALIEAGLNEDKCMGPFFIHPNYLEHWIEDKDFRKMFASKVLMYLFEDAAKQKRGRVFNTENNKYKTFSGICKDFSDGKNLDGIFAIKGLFDSETASEKGDE